MQNSPGFVQIPASGLQHTLPTPQLFAPQGFERPAQQEAASPPSAGPRQPPN